MSRPIKPDPDDPIDTDTYSIIWLLSTEYFKPNKLHQIIRHCGRSLLLKETPFKRRCVFFSDASELFEIHPLPKVFFTHHHVEHEGERYGTLLSFSFAQDSKLAIPLLQQIARLYPAFLIQTDETILKDPVIYTSADVLAFQADDYTSKLYRPGMDCDPVRVFDLFKDDGAEEADSPRTAV